MFLLADQTGLNLEESCGGEKFSRHVLTERDSGGIFSFLPHSSIRCFSAFLVGHDCGQSAEGGYAVEHVLHHGSTSHINSTIFCLGLFDFFPRFRYFSR